MISKETNDEMPSRNTSKSQTRVLNVDLKMINADLQMINASFLNEKGTQAGIESSEPQTSLPVNKSSRDLTQDDKSVIVKNSDYEN